jgi:hypothetical protein
MRRSSALILVAALWVGRPVGAGILIDASFNTTGTPWATIQWSPDQFHPGGALVQESVYTGPFSVTVTGWDHTGPFDAFCVDVWHEMGTSNPGIQAAAVGPLSGITGAPYFDLTTDPQVGNKMAFLLSGYANGSSWTADQKGAFQLALWELIDPRFQVTSTSTAGLLSAFQGILGLFNQNAWVGVAAYDSSRTYGGGTLFQVTHDGSRYQDLATAESGPSSHPAINLLAVPEPSTLAPAGVAVLTGLWYARRRRRRRAAA